MKLAFLNQEIAMWINEKIFYHETFLSDYELEYLDKIIEENSDVVSELLSDPELGGYKTFPVSDPIMDSIGNRIFKFLKDQNIPFVDFYPREEIQFIGPGSGQSVHIDGNGSGQDVEHGIVVYISGPEAYSGGEIFYPDYDVEIKPARGSIAIHAGNIKHGVKEVGGGNRYVIVAFTNNQYHSDLASALK